MSAPAGNTPLKDLLVEEFRAEAGRHQGEAPSAGVWEAQADAFGSRLHRVLVAAAAAEIKAGLDDGTPLCLHKAAVAFDKAARSLVATAFLFTQALIALEERDQQVDEGGEA